MMAESWFTPERLYDKESGTCTQNSDCDAASKRTGEPHKCALVEVYQATSIQISEFVKETRSMQCIPAAKCNE